MTAARKYEDTRGARFSTYAGIWIRSALIEAVNWHDRTVRLPEAEEQLIRRARRAISRAGRVLPPAELAHVLSITPAAADRVVGHLTGLREVSLDAPGRHEDADWSLHDVLPDDREPADAALARDEDHGALYTLLSGLTDRERGVLLRRMDGEQFDVIGDRLGITRPRAQQIEARAVDRLRRAARREGFAPTTGGGVVCRRSDAPTTGPSKGAGE